MDRMDINQLRGEVDQINDQLLSLLSRRGEIIREIGYYKQEKGLDYFDPAREAQILSNVTKKNQGPFSDQVIQRIFREIFRSSISLMTREEGVELLVSRRDPEHSTIISVDGADIGGYSPCLIAGPCSVESRDQIERTASELQRRGIPFIRGGLFKPRTSPYSFQGLGQQGIEIFREVAEAHNLRIVTEVTDPRQIELLLPAVHILQVGARNMYNYELLKELGRIGKPVLLKRGFMATIEEFLHSAEYVFSRGNSRIILCERGIRTFDHQTRNTLDISAIPILKKSSHLPVIADLSHALGRTDIMAPMARSVLAAGADGLMIEIHPDPELALSDNCQQLDFHQLDDLLRAIGWNENPGKPRNTTP